MNKLFINQNQNWHFRLKCSQSERNRRIACGLRSEISKLLSKLIFVLCIWLPARSKWTIWSSKTFFFTRQKFFTFAIPATVTEIVIPLPGIQENGFTCERNAFVKESRRQVKMKKKINRKFKKFTNERETLLPSFILERLRCYLRNIKSNMKALHFTEEACKIFSNQIFLWCKRLISLIFSVNFTLCFHLFDWFHSVLSPFRSIWSARVESQCAFSTFSPSPSLVRSRENWRSKRELEDDKLNEVEQRIFGIYLRVRYNFPCLNALGSDLSLFKIAQRLPVFHAARHVDILKKTICICLEQKLLLKRKLRKT